MPRWPDMDESKRCVATVAKTGERCAKARIRGGTVCATHGGSVGRVRDAAARRVQEQEAAAAARRLNADMDLGQLSDPIAALEYAVASSHAMAIRLVGLVGELPDDQLRWQGKSGEHLRGEVVAAQKALDSLRGAATDALRLGLEQRRAGVREQTVQMLETALDRALTASGIGFERVQHAREIFRRNLAIATAGQAE